jgi:uncharacterized protein (DUF983 family)
MTQKASVTGFLCPQCSKDVGTALHRNFFGFPEAKCPHCGSYTMYPLGKAAIVIYIIGAAVVGAIIILRLASNSLPIGFLVIEAMTFMAIMQNFKVQKNFKGRPVATMPVMGLERSSEVKKDQWSSYVAKPLFGLFKTQFWVRIGIAVFLCILLVTYYLVKF